MLGYGLKKKKQTNKPERQVAAVACSVFQCDSAEAQGGLLGLSCLSQHRPSLADPWRDFSATKFSPCEAIDVYQQNQQSWSLGAKEKWLCGRKNAKRCAFTFRNDQMTLMSRGNTCQTLSLSPCKDLFNSCSALPWDVETFSGEDGSVGETVSDGATQTKVLIWRTVLY